MWLATRSSERFVFSEERRVERSHSGLVRRFAKPLYGLYRIEGSNPSLSDFPSPFTILPATHEYKKLVSYGDGSLDRFHSFFVHMGC